jgi:ubiquinone/menaquinone biosynthesis C-methylase UbiE
VERRTDAVEYLDGPLEDQAALVGNLRDLGRINRRLGGIDLSAAAMEALAAHRNDLTLLDVGTGAADIPIALIRRARRRGRRLQAIGIDSRAEVLEAALSLRPAIALAADLQLHVGDGRALRYPDRSFDIAHASLVLHHLERDDAVALLGEMRRVARLGVIVNDLDRSRIGLVGAWLIGHLLTGNRLTRHDAPLSVRRAYRPGEMAELLRAAGLVPVRTIRGAYGQRYAIAALPISGARLAGAVDGPGGADRLPDPHGAGDPAEPPKPDATDVA